MSEETEIHPDKVRAYLASSYRIGHADEEIVLHIGEHSARLATLFARIGVNCGAFLTAYNPRGARQSSELNDKAHAQLASMIAAHGIEPIEGSGSEDETDWPAELSYFAPGLPLDQAKNLGIQFDQDAIVWVGADARPQLILLR